jgi:heme/copper-type cytochrome/quinol oxidase subunit 3
MDAAAQSPADGFVEPPELEEHLHRTGFRIAVSSTVMFFLGFVFAYFYLRSLNNSGLWKPAGVDPPQLFGALIVAAFVSSALAFAYASARAARADTGWVPAAGAALALGLAGCVLQAFEYAHLSFGPRSGGYGSVFIGWTATYALFVLFAMYRVETIFAAGLRNRQRSGYQPVGFGPASYYWTMLAGIGILAWIILYLI